MPTYPFYFCYIDLTDVSGYPPVPGLTCEKGCWRIGNGMEDINDDRAVPIVWEYWKEHAGEGFAARFLSARALRDYWEDWE